MSRYNVFQLRAKGTKESCEKFALILNQYEGHSDDPYYAAKGGSADNYSVEIRGALCGDLYKYMIDLPSYEESLEGLSKTLGLAIEVFASDPGDREFEYYYYDNGELVDSFALPTYISDEYLFEELEISQEDRIKYKQTESGAFVLGDKYSPDAEWSKDGDEMNCRFKIELIESQEKEEEFIIEGDVLKKYKGNGIEVFVPEGVTTIASFAFMYKDSVKKIFVPDSVTNIGDGAFFSCYGLEEIRLPSTVKKFGGAVFANCQNLGEIQIPAGVKKLNSAEVAYMKIGMFDDCENLQKVSLPESLTQIGNQTFSGCSKLREIILPEALQKIGKNAFCGCSLSSIVISEKVVSIGEFAFAKCVQLNNVIFKGSNIKFGKGVFYNCGNISIEADEDILKSISESSMVIKNGVLKNYIGNGGEVVIPDGVTEIAAKAFENCTQLESVFIPTSVKKVGKRAFYNCGNIRLLSDSPSLLEEIKNNEYLIKKNVLKEYNGPGGDITIPDGVTEIYGKNWSNLGFSYCTELFSVRLSDTVKSIDNFAFSACKKLTSLFATENLTSIGKAAFSDCTTLTIYAPADSYAEQYAKENKISFKAVK